MRKKRFSVERITAALAETGRGMPVAESRKDDTGGQIAVFGRLGSRPFSIEEMHKL